jgi:hypothetical protein
MDSRLSVAADYTTYSPRRLGPEPPVAHAGTMRTDQSTAVRFRLVAIVFLCIGLLSGALITEIKQNISINYHDGRPAVHCFGLPGSLGP